LQHVDTPEKAASYGGADQGPKDFERNLARAGEFRNALLDFTATGLAATYLAK
jgi:hypothetical protein